MHIYIVLTDYDVLLSLQKFSYVTFFRNKLWYIWKTLWKHVLIIPLLSLVSKQSILFLLMYDKADYFNVSRKVYLEIWILRIMRDYEGLWMWSSFSPLHNKYPSVHKLRKVRTNFTVQHRSNSNIQWMSSNLFSTLL